MLLPSPVTIIRARDPMYEITVAEALLAVLRENRVRFEGLTGSEVSIEWTWTGTMTEYLGIHTCRTPPAYLQAPMLVIANEGFGIARDGQSRRGTTPTVMILDIDRVAPPPTLTGMAGTRIITIDPLGGRTKIASGIKADLGQIGTGDLSSVIPPLLLAHQAPGRLGRSVKRGNNENGIQGEGQDTLLRPRLVQIVGMTRERL